MKLNRLVLALLFAVIFDCAIPGQLQTANAQIDLTWNGGGDGTTFSDDANWTPSAGVGGPEFEFSGDALLFNSAGITITNDLDPATNTTAGSEGEPLSLAHGAGDISTSGSFYFLDGAGNFTFDGFPVEVGIGPAGSASTTFVRADAGAGLTQTFDLPIQFSGGGNNRSRAIVMNNTVRDSETNLPTTYGTVILNGPVDFSNDRINITENAARIVLNADNLGGGSSSLSNQSFRTITSRAVIQVRATAGEVLNGFGSEIVLNSDQALGDQVTTGSWAAGDLDMRGGLHTLSAAFVDNTEGPRDLSDNFFQIQSGSGAVGGSINYKSVHDLTIGHVANYRGNYTLLASNTGKLTIAHGIYLTDNQTPRSHNLAASGPSGNDGQIDVNGPIHNSIIDPISAANAGSAATGGITPTVDFLSADGVTQINGALIGSFGTVRLNADSSSTLLGGEIRSINGATVIAGNDNAFGDANSLVSVQASSTVDIGTQTIPQRFSTTEGTIRGTGSLTNEADWTIAGTVQPGGESPSTADVLTFDFSSAAAGNTLQFESTSIVDFALDAGLISSTIDVLGASTGGTNVVFDDNTFALTDLTAGTLSEGTYTLFDGDANTTYSLGAGVTVDAPSGFIGSVSLSGDDVIVELVEGTSGDADFNGDDDVDGEDFLSWQRNFGNPDGLPANVLEFFGDANGDEAIDGADLDIWESQYGPGSPLLGASAVPEPSSLFLLFTGIALGATRPRRS